MIPRNREEFEKLSKEAKEGGFDYFEISLDYPIPKEKDMLKEISNMLKDSNLKFSFHAPWRGIDLASPWEPLRRGAVEVIKEVLKLVAEMDAMYLVIHLTTSERLGERVDEIIDAALRSIKELSEFSKELGVKFYIENVGKLGHPDILGKVMDETDAEFCLDLVHAIVDFSKRHKIDIERVEVDEVLETWKNSLGSKVKCMHIHGFSLIDGRLRTHVPLVYPITKRVAAKYIAIFDPEYVTLEIFHTNEGPATLRYVAKELSEIIGWLKVYGKR